MGERPLADRLRPGPVCDGPGRYRAIPADDMAQFERFGSVRREFRFHTDDADVGP